MQDAVNVFMFENAQLAALLSVAVGVRCFVVVHSVQGLVKHAFSCVLLVVIK